MRRTLLSLLVLAAAGYLFLPGAPDRLAGASEGEARGEKARQMPNEAASLDARRQQLAEKEVALKAKEEALGKLSATLDARVNELNAAKKGLEGAIVAKKKADSDRYKKMLKIYKGLKPDQAGALLNKLDDKMLIELLNQMDQKTAVKLIPYISQPRVLEWTRLNLQGN